MEYFDIYDKDRNKTGKVIKRGERMNDDEYHLFVQIWIVNDKGKFLVQQRAKHLNHFPLYWNTCGGNVVKDEDTDTCAKRELKEELGLDFDKINGKKFDSRYYYEDNQNYIYDSYICETNVKCKDIIIQKEEVRRVKYMTIKKVRRMMNNKKFFVYDNDYLDYLEKYGENKKNLNK